MKRHTLILFMLFFLSASAFAQCRSSRTFLSIGTSGNEVFSQAGASQLVGVSGISLHYGKSSFSGFSYGLMFNTRKSSHAFSGEVYSRNASAIGFELRQELLGLGRWTISPFGNVYVGGMKEGNLSNSGTEALKATPYGGAELGLELDIPITCFLSAYGRSAVAYEQSIVSSPISQGGWRGRPVSQVGIRLKV